MKIRREERLTCSLLVYLKSTTSVYLKIIRLLNHGRIIKDDNCTNDSSTNSTCQKSVKNIWEPRQVGRIIGVIWTS